MIQSANSASVQSLNSLGRSGSSQMSPIHNKCSYFISVIRFRVSSNTYIQLAIVGCQLDLQSQRCPVFIIILPSIRLAASSDTCNLYNWGLTSVTITQQPGPVNSADETSCKSKKSHCLLDFGTDFTPAIMKLPRPSPQQIRENGSPSRAIPN